MAKHIHIDKNFVVKNKHFDEALAGLIFNDEPFEFIDESVDVWGLLVQENLFPSRSECRRNWTRSGREIPDGFTHFRKIGKVNSEIAIWKPLPETLDNE